MKKPETHRKCAICDVEVVLYNKMCHSIHNILGMDIWTCYDMVANSVSWPYFLEAVQVKCLDIYIML